MITVNSTADSFVKDVDTMFEQGFVMMGFQKRHGDALVSFWQVKESE